MGLSASDRTQIRDIKQSVLGGRLNAGNPGFDTYNKTGGHGSSRLPPAPGGQTYYEYRIGSATAPAAGFANRAGEAGVRRLVLLVSESQRKLMAGNGVCYVHPGPPAVAIALPFSGDYPSLLSLRQNTPDGMALTLPALPNSPDYLASNQLRPVGTEQVRKLAHTFPAKRYSATSQLPAAGCIREIYFKRSVDTKYMIHKSYFSEDHYQGFSEADFV